MVAPALLPLAPHLLPPYLTTPRPPTFLLREMKTYVTKTPIKSMGIRHTNVSSITKKHHREIPTAVIPFPPFPMTSKLISPFVLPTPFPIKPSRLLTFDDGLSFRA